MRHFDSQYFLMLVAIGPLGEKLWLNNVQDPIFPFLFLPLYHLLECEDKAIVVFRDKMSPDTLTINVGDNILRRQNSLKAMMGLITCHVSAVSCK